MKGVILVVDNATRSTKKTPFLNKLLQRLSDDNWDTEVITRSSEIDMSVSYAAAILTGSPMLLTEPLLMDCISANTTALLQLKCPILGICFGMQVMVMAYGGSLERLDTFQKGKKSIHLEPNSILGAGMKTSCVMEAYEDSVKRIPSGFRVVGIDKNTHDIKAIEKTDFPYRVGVLFHPEDGGSGLCLLNNFLNFVYQTM